MAKDLQGKTIVLGITGGIAAYKMPNVAHALAKRGADVHVLMTRNATEFIAPLVFETLTNRRCIVDTFDRNFQYDVAHVSLANAADLMLIAPATANVIAKLAHGLADDMLTTVTLAATCPKLVAPAMNTHMLENPITRDNIDTLARYGFTVIPSGAGLLACGDVGSGRLPEEQTLLDYVRALFAPKDLAARKSSSPPAPPRNPWTRCATSPTIPPARWGMPWPGRRHARRRCNAAHRPHRAAPGALCQHRALHDRHRPVRSGQGPCHGRRRPHDGRRRGRLPPGGGGR